MGVPIRVHKSERMRVMLIREQFTVTQDRPICKIDKHTLNYKVAYVDSEVTCLMCQRILREREEIRLANV
jgi:hypothetical protein